MGGGETPRELAWLRELDMARAPSQAGVPESMRTSFNLNHVTWWKISGRGCGVGGRGVGGVLWRTKVKPESQGRGPIDPSWLSGEGGVESGWSRAVSHASAKENWIEQMATTLSLFVHTEHTQNVLS